MNVDPFSVCPCGHSLYAIIRWKAENVYWHFAKLGRHESEILMSVRSRVVSLGEETLSIVQCAEHQWTFLLNMKEKNHSVAKSHNVKLNFTVDRVLLWLLLYLRLSMTLLTSLH